MSRNEYENSQVFTPEDVAAGYADEFLKVLLLMQDKLTNKTLDIRISSDGTCRTVSWLNVYDEEPVSYEVLGPDQFIEEYVYAKDGRSVGYLKSDLENPVFCADEGIVYYPESHYWEKIQKTPNGEK